MFATSIRTRNKNVMRSHLRFTSYSSLQCSKRHEYQQSARIKVFICISEVDNHMSDEFLSLPRFAAVALQCLRLSVVQLGFRHQWGGGGIASCLPTDLINLPVDINYMNCISRDMCEIKSASKIGFFTQMPMYIGRNRAAGSQVLLRNFLGITDIMLFYALAQGPNIGQIRSFRHIYHAAWLG